MKLTSLFFRNARAPQLENKVPLKAMTPLILKNRVSSKNQKSKEHGCMQETVLLLACLEENEYDDKRCIPQFKKLDDCCQTYLKNIKSARIEQGQLTPVPNSKNFTAKQISYLLRRYPTV